MRRQLAANQEALERQAAALERQLAEALRQLAAANREAEVRRACPVATRSLRSDGPDLRPSARRDRRGRHLAVSSLESSILPPVSYGGRMSVLRALGARAYTVKKRSQYSAMTRSVPCRDPRGSLGVFPVFFARCAGHTLKTERAELVGVLMMAEGLEVGLGGGHKGGPKG
eukprot:1060363-Prorocentrum_minimum.AAC.1